MQKPIPYLPAWLSESDKFAAGIMDDQGQWLSFSSNWNRIFPGLQLQDSKDLPPFLASLNLQPSTIPSFKKGKIHHRLPFGPEVEIECHRYPTSAEEQAWLILFFPIRNGLSFDSLLHATKSGHWVVDCQTGEVQWTGAWKSILGYSESDQIPDLGKDWVQLCHPDDFHWGGHQFDHLVKNEAEKFEGDIRIRHKKGHYIWIHSYGSVTELNPDGTVKTISGLIFDISKQKETEIGLQVQNERLNGILNGTHAGTWEWDLSNQAFTLDYRWAEILGWKVGKSRLLPALELISFIEPSDFKRSDEKVRKLISGELSSYQCEMRVQRADGNWHWVNMIGKVARWNKDGKPSLISGIMLDIQDQVRARQEVEIQKNRLENVLDGTGAGIWEWDVESGKLDVNDRWKAILHYGPNELEDFTLQYWAGLVHPDDLPHEQEKIRAILNGQVDVYQSEYRKRTKSGQWIWCQSRGKVTERNHDGRPIKLAGTCQDIHVRKDMENEIRRLSLVARITSNSVVITNANRQIMWVNEAFLRMTGYTLPEVIGKNPGHFLQCEASDPEVVKQMQAHLGLGQAIQCEIVNQKKSGELFWVFLDIQPMPDENGGFIAVQSDVTAARLAARKLQESEARLLANLNNTPHVAVQWYDESGKVFYWNPASEAIYGLKKEEAIGKYAGEIFGESFSLEVFFEVFDEIKKTGKPYGPIELLLPSRNGHDVWVLSTMFKFPIRDGQFGLVCMDVDISNQKRAEESLLQILHTKSIQNSRLKDFSFMTSHNLRSSVVNLMGMMEILEEEVLDNELVPLIRATVDNLDKTIRTMNQLVQFEEEGEHIQLQACAVRDCLDRVIASHQGTITRAEIEIRVTLPDQLQISGHPAYLESVFHNLITNALKYGMGESQREIRIWAEPVENHVQIFIQDFGPGMDLDRIRGRIFKPGARFHANSSDGQGLGLFMTKRQVELMGGNLELFSKPDKGTTFKLIFNCP